MVNKHSHKTMSPTFLSVAFQASKLAPNTIRQRAPSPSASIAGCGRTAQIGRLDSLRSRDAATIACLMRSLQRHQTVLFPLFLTVTPTFFDLKLSSILCLLKIMINMLCYFSYVVQFLFYFSFFSLSSYHIWWIKMYKNYFDTGNKYDSDTDN